MASSAPVRLPDDASSNRSGVSCFTRSHVPARGRKWGLACGAVRCYVIVGDADRNRAARARRAVSEPGEAKMRKMITGREMSGGAWPWQCRAGFTTDCGVMKRAHCRRVSLTQMPNPHVFISLPDCLLAHSPPSLVPAATLVSTPAALLLHGCICIALPCPASPRPVVLLWSTSLESA